MDKIYFLDDVEAQRKLFKLHLDKIQNSIVEAIDSIDNLKLKVLNDNPQPDLIIVDFDLGEGSNASDLIKWAKESGITCPILIISATQEFVKGVESTGNAALLKPNKPEEWEHFLSKVERMLHTHSIRKLEKKNERDGEDIKKKLEEITTKLDSMDSRLGKLEEDSKKVSKYVEDTSKLDLVSKVDNFLTEAKKSPLLKLAVVGILLTLAFFGVKGFKL